MIYPQVDDQFSAFVLISLYISSNCPCSSPDDRRIPSLACLLKQKVDRRLFSLFVFFMQGTSRKDVLLDASYCPVYFLPCSASPVCPALLCPACETYCFCILERKKAHIPGLVHSAELQREEKPGRANFAGAEHSRGKQIEVGRATPERSKAAQIWSARGNHPHAIPQNRNYAQREKSLDK